MARPEAMSEPSMEEILASIRKIIAEEPGSSPYPGIDRRRGAQPAERADSVPPLPQASAPPPVPHAPHASASPAAQAPMRPPAPTPAHAKTLDDDLADLLGAPRAAVAPTPDVPAREMPPVPPVAKSAPPAVEAPVAAKPVAEVNGHANGHDGAPDWLLARVAPAAATPPVPQPAPRMPDLGAMRPGEALFAAQPKAAAPVQPKPDPVPVPAPSASPPLKAEAPVAPSPAPVAAAAKSIEPSGSPLPPFPASAVAKPVAPPPLQPMSTLYGREEPPKKAEPVASASPPAPEKAAEAAAAVAKSSETEPPLPAAAAAAAATVTKSDVKPEPKKPEEPVKSVAPVQAPKPVQVKAVQVKPQPSAAETAKIEAPVSNGGVQTMEDTVAELLRPMLRQWLDSNMPRIVEKALRVELAESLKKPSGLKN